MRPVLIVLLVWMVVSFCKPIRWRYLDRKFTALTYRSVRRWTRGAHRAERLSPECFRGKFLGMTFRLVFVATSALACGHASVPSTADTGSPRPERGGELVDVGGPSLFLDCDGNASPTVILEAGGGMDGTAWKNVVPVLRGSTRTCAYDRAGTGRSSAAPRPHTIQQMVDELDALLDRAQLDSSYVLVGHSLGGLLVRVYASQHRSMISGMVLVDPTTEEQDVRMWSLMPEDLMRQFRQGLRMSPEGLDYESFVAGMAQLRSSDRALGDTPLVVLTAVGSTPGTRPALPDEVGTRVAREWLAMHEEISRLSSNSAHLVVESSGHDMANDAPQVVIAAVEEVVASARTKRPLNTGSLQSMARAHPP